MGCYNQFLFRILSEMAREGHDVCTHALSAGSRILLRCLTDPSLDQVTWAHPVSRILSVRCYHKFYKT